MHLGPFGQKFRFVDPLCAGQDLLSTHKHVVRVGPLGVVGIGHRVKGTDGEGKLVEAVVSCVVLGLDKTT